MADLVSVHLKKRSIISFKLIPLQYRFLVHCGVTGSNFETIA